VEIFNGSGSYAPGACAYYEPPVFLACQVSTEVRGDRTLAPMGRADVLACELAGRRKTDFAFANTTNRNWII